jgi:hypothetical protein
VFYNSFPLSVNVMTDNQSQNTKTEGTATRGPEEDAETIEEMRIDWSENM